MRVARVEAQAKVNLMLRVLPHRDEQGFHELLTMFHRIDLADEILVRAGGSSRSIDCAGPCTPAGGLGPPEQNLAYRAAVEFRNRRGWPDGFAIEITKRIPVGGGLGGGSADAGGVLRALNAMAPRPLSAGELASAAAALGSDVPFLASEHVRAMGEGRGTELSHGSDRPMYASYRMLIAVPPFSINTAEAYRWLDQDRAQGRHLPDTPQPIAPMVGHPSEADARRALDESTHNDFEAVVEARHPEIRVIRRQLVEKGADLARLAGSGSCVFGLFRQLPPESLDLEFDTLLLPTRLASRVVQVEVLE